jgi:hypothetical protein
MRGVGSRKGTHNSLSGPAHSCRLEEWGSMVILSRFRNDSGIHLNTEFAGETARESTGSRDFESYENYK